MLIYADTKCALNIPRDEDAEGKVLPVAYQEHCWGIWSPAFVQERLHSPLCAGGAAQSKHEPRGKHCLLKSQVPQQGTGNKNMLQKQYSVHGERGSVMHD